MSDTDFQTLISEANTALAAGLFEDAFRTYRAAAEADETRPEAPYGEGRALAALGRQGVAVQAFRRTLTLLRAENSAALDRVAMTADVLVRLAGEPLDDDGRAELARVLAHRRVDARSLLPTALAVLGSDPDLADPVLLALLQNAVIADPELEDCLTLHRRQALLAVAGGEEPKVPAGFLKALAAQSALNGFCWAETDEETEALMALGSPENDAVFLIAASYRPVGAMTPLPDGIPSKAVMDILDLQLDQPFQDTQQGRILPSLTAIAPGTSEAVRKQYDESPYPRWIGFPVRDPRPMADILPALLPHADLPPLPASPKILIAGCGTGFEALMTATRFEGADVLAVDLSRHALGYAERRRETLKIDTVRFAQADVTAMGDVDQRFDLIQSTGVLHHLADPLAGWQVLRGLLAENGLMRIALYSRRARAHLEAVRGLAVSNGLQPTADGIRAFRMAVREKARQEGEASPFSEILRDGDFYAAPECRDLVFHVQEAAFDLGEVAAMIDTLGLRFLGFEHGDPVAMQVLQQAAPGADPKDFSAWDAAEQAKPDLFRGMYQFWVAG